MTTNDLPEFDVSVQMVRKIGPDTERRTFTARVPAVDLQHAEAAAYGLGHGINDATRYGWKFEDVDPNVSAEPASDTAAKVDELTAALTQSRAQAATYANEIGNLTAENARLRQQRDAQNDVVEAAKAWRGQYGNTSVRFGDACTGLVAAVDALPKAEATR